MAVIHGWAWRDVLDFSASINYGGVPSRKEFLGDPISPLSASLFPKVRAILVGSSALMVLGAAGVMAWR